MAINMIRDAAFLVGGFLPVHAQEEGVILLVAWNPLFCHTRLLQVSKSVLDFVCV